MDLGYVSYMVAIQSDKTGSDCSCSRTLRAWPESSWRRFDKWPGDWRVMFINCTTLSCQWWWRSSSRAVERDFLKWLTIRVSLFTGNVVFFSILNVPGFYFWTCSESNPASCWKEPELHAGVYWCAGILCCNIIDELVYIHNHPNKPHLLYTMAGEQNDQSNLSTWQTHMEENKEAACQKEIKTDWWCNLKEPVCFRLK